MKPFLTVPKTFPQGLLLDLSTPAWPASRRLQDFLQLGALGRERAELGLLEQGTSAVDGPIYVQYKIYSLT